MCKDDKHAFNGFHEQSGLTIKGRAEDVHNDVYVGPTTKKLINS